MSDDFIRLDEPDVNLEDRLHNLLSEWRSARHEDDRGGPTDRTIISTVAVVLRSLINGLPEDYRMHAGAEVRAIFNRAD